MRALGIDLGTSLSSAAIIEDGKAVPLRVGTAASLLIGDSYCLPTTVFIDENGEILLGQAADNSRMKNPIRYRKEFKRDLGTSEPYRIGDMEIFPEDLYREFLKYFKAAAEERLGGSIERAVVTHPANFAGFKKELIQKAGLMAGLSKLKLIDEPTAAAIYYASKEKIETGEKLLVYDLGGGTFDISIIERTEEGFKPLTAPLGIERCGGVDFQRKIYEDIITAFNEEILPILSAGGIAAKQFAFMLETESTRIKHLLSTALKAESIINFPGTFQFKTYEITRERFQNLIHDDIEATCKKIEDIVKNAGLQMKQIDKVLLVGGSSRIPCVEEAIRKTTGKPVSKDADTELIVALGAAIYAGMGKSSEEKKDNNSLKNGGRTQNNSTSDDRTSNKNTSEDKTQNKNINEDKSQNEKTTEGKDQNDAISKDKAKNKDTNCKEDKQKSKNPFQVPEKYKYFFKNSTYSSSQIAAMEIGSGYSRAACILDGRPTVITNSYGEKQIPTAISFSEDRCCLGLEAKQKLTNRGAATYLDINNLIRLQRKIDIDGVKYQPELLYAFIIQWLKEDAERLLQKRISQIVLVVPMYFSYNMKKAVRYAAELAGVEVLTIVDSSTAAAIDYCYKNPSPGSTLLMCSVGSESTEFSTCETGNGKVTAAHKLGFILNGSNEYTRRIMEYVVSECRRINGIDLLSQPWVRESLFIVSEAAKKELMRSFNTSIRIAGFVNSPNALRSPFIDLKKSDYAVITSAITNIIAGNCDLKGILGSRISKIVLTGEGGYTPLIKERINGLTRKEVVVPEESDASAVLGGAIQAGIISNEIKNFTAEYSLNKSIGIRSIDSKNNILLPKSTVLPAQAAQILTAGSHFQLSEGIVIAEGENGNGQQVEVLEQIELTSLTAQTGGPMQVEVKIEVTAKDNINLSIRNIKTNKEIYKSL